MRTVVGSEGIATPVGAVAILDGLSNTSEGLGRCVSVFTGKKYDINFVKNFAEEVSPEYGKMFYDTTQMVLSIRGVINGANKILGYAVVEQSTGKLITNLGENGAYEGEIIVQPFLVKPGNERFLDWLDMASSGLGIMDGIVDASDF